MLGERTTVYETMPEPGYNYQKWMEAELSAMTTQKAWSRPPLNMQFSLLMFTSSGLLVRYLKVFEKNNYSSVKWVRYMTRAGSYEIRF